MKINLLVLKLIVYSITYKDVSNKVVLGLYSTVLFSRECIALVFLSNPVYINLRIFPSWVKQK